MDFAAELSAVELRLAKAGIAVGDVLADSEINQSTWSRWKTGAVQGPHFATWAKFKASAEKLIEQRRAA